MLTLPSIDQILLVLKTSNLSFIIFKFFLKWIIWSNELKYNFYQKSGSIFITYFTWNLKLVLAAASQVICIQVIEYYV